MKKGKIMVETNEFSVYDANGIEIHVSKLKLGNVVYHLNRQEFGHITGFARNMIEELVLVCKFPDKSNLKQEFPTHPCKLTIFAD